MMRVMIRKANTSLTLLLKTQFLIIWFPKASSTMP